MSMKPSVSQKRRRTNCLPNHAALSKRFSDQSMSMKKPIASLSLDLDNKWSYMKTHGDDGWKSFPSYLNLLVPRVLEFLKQRNLTITFFIVGQDAALEKNR